MSQTAIIRRLRAIATVPPWQPRRRRPVETSTRWLPLTGAMALSVNDRGNIAATPAVGGIPDDEIFDLAASKIILQEDQAVVGWPVLGTGHLLVCDDPADPLPLSVAQYSLRLAGQGALETYGLTPLPEPVRIQTFEPLKVTVAGEN